MTGPARPPRVGGRTEGWRWAAALLAVGLAVAAAAEWHGASARRAFRRPPGLASSWAMVADAGVATRAWDAGGVAGKPVVVLTGRWSSIPGDTVEQLLAGRADATFEDLVNRDTALLIAAKEGLARSFVIVMPEAAWRTRLAEMAGSRGLLTSPGCATLPWAGIERRFCRPEGLRGSGEPSLVLVEPSWFAREDEPPLETWLARTGVVVELGLVASEDGVADEAMRERAAAFAERMGAARLEVGP